MPQMTDSRGFRTGAAISVLLLGVAALLHVTEPTGSASALLVAAIAAAMLLSAATGLRVSLLGLPFRLLRERGVIGAPAPKDLQPVLGLRLAQVMGGTMLILGVAADAAFAADLAALAFVVAVATLQSFLAITGICVACKLYGVVVWFQNRSLPQGATKIAPQKIRMTKGSGR
ncbi:MAG: hypothetical protein RIQ87_382 [Chloroflexota bacterium]